MKIVLTDQKNSWNLIKCESDLDFVSAVDFLNDEYKKTNEEQWSKESLKWKISGNTHVGKGIIFCAKLNNKTIGIISLTLKYINLCGKKVVVGELGDGYTSKKIYTNKPIKHYECDTFSEGINNNNDYIKKSIAGRLCAEVISWSENNGIYGIYGTPNDLAMRSWINRLNFRLINSANKKVIITATLFKIRFKLNKNILKVLGLLLNKLNSFFLAPYKFILKKYELNYLESNNLDIGVEYDELWSKYSKNERIEIIRDKKWLIWRYIAKPENNYKIITLKQSNVLVGWCVLNISYELDYKKITICDWVYLVNDHIWSAFICTILEKYEYQNSLVTYWEIEKSKISKKLFPMSYNYDDVNIIYKHTSVDMLYIDKRNFHTFMIGHSDNI